MQEKNSLPPVILVETIMTSKVISVSLTTSINEAIDLLLQNRISGAPIVDFAGNVVSIVSEGDLLKLVAACRQRDHFVRETRPGDQS